MKTKLTLAVMVLTAVAATADARIKLTTLPERETVRVDQIRTSYPRRS